MKKRWLNIGLRSVGIACLALTGLSMQAQAQTGSEAALVIQVPQSFYQHPVRLLHPYINYWHPRGETAAQVGVNSFQAKNYATSSCEADAKGQALVVIEPNLFYNPQTGVFYSQIIAKVYDKPGAESALANPLLTVKGEGQARGWLTYNIEGFAQQSYQQAFDQVIARIQQDAGFQRSMRQGAMQTYSALCQSINTLSQPKAMF